MTFYKLSWKSPHRLPAHSSSQSPIQSVDRVVELEPQLARGYEMLGMAHLLAAIDGAEPRQAGFAKVQEYAAKTLTLDPKSSIGHSLLARVATLYTRDWAVPKRESDYALSLAPHDWGALYTAADLEFVLGENEKAQRLFKASLVADPLNADSRMQLANVLATLGRYREAENEARRALAITPTYLAGHGTLGGILLEQGRFDEARREMEEESVEGGRLEDLAEVYHALGRDKDAKISLDTAIRAGGRSRLFDRVYIRPPRPDRSCVPMAGSRPCATGSHADLYQERRRVPSLASRPTLPSRAAQTEPSH
jgi:tetratricopeptide (TPR) repeat protein